MIETKKGGTQTSHTGTNGTQRKPSVVIIGAGPAGLTAAYELSKAGVPSTVLEADNIVGGIARTANYKGYLFDMGGHRFFTKVSMVEKMWHEVLGKDLLTRPRSSRIFYRKKFFSYPLEPGNALSGLGLIEAARCGFSYMRSRAFPTRPEPDLETWVSNRFGRRLYEIFFRTYTEKVWGMSCKEIRADWAAQRIKDLSLSSAILNALRPKKKNQPKDKVIKTLIGEFLYPRKGPGMMWEATQSILEAAGSRVVMETPVEKIFWEPGRITGVEAGGQRYEADHFVSTMPIRELFESMEPAPPPEVKEAASRLKYRDFLTVALILKDRKAFEDNWIYIHEPDVKVGRIQNFKSWSPEMVPEPQNTCLGLEYFCFEGDGLWNAPDSELIELGKRELLKLGLAEKDDFVDGTVVRVKKAYPVYDEHYQQVLEKVQAFVDQISNLQLVGRNGMHRYNNQDHAMMTALLTVANIKAGTRLYDVWRVNEDAEYIEGDVEAGTSAGASGVRLVPRPVAKPAGGSTPIAPIPD